VAQSAPPIAENRRKRRYGNSISSIVLGGLLALRFRIRGRTLGLIMAFGAGVPQSSDVIRSELHTASAYWSSTCEGISLILR